MKPQITLLLLFVCLFMTSCYSLTPNVTAFTNIKQGMPQAEVERRLGKPELVRFNMENEEWEYNQLSASYTTSIVITFVNKYVVAMDMFNLYPNRDKCYTPTITTTNQ